MPVIFLETKIDIIMSKLLYQDLNPPKEELTDLFKRISALFRGRTLVFPKEVINLTEWVLVSVNQEDKRIRKSVEKSYYQKHRFEDLPEEERIPEPINYEPEDNTYSMTPTSIGMYTFSCSDCSYSGVKVYEGTTCLEQFSNNSIVAQHSIPPNERVFL